MHLDRENHENSLFTVSQELNSTMLLLSSSSQRVILSVVVVVVVAAAVLLSSIEDGKRNTISVEAFSVSSSCSSHFSTRTFLTKSSSSRQQGMAPYSIKHNSIRLFETSSSADISTAESKDEQDTTPPTAAGSQQLDRSKLDLFLSKKYPKFYKTLMNDEMKKVIATASSGDKETGSGGGRCTVFVPNAEAFEDLGSKKLQQLDDPRNIEIREKMGSYHVIATESVSAVELLTEDWTKVKPGKNKKPNTVIASIITMSGEVPVGRSSNSLQGIGGLLGFMTKEGDGGDGDIVIGPDAKIVQSFIVDGNYVHEVDSLISPLILWRYCDQLRIPGF